MPSNPVLNWERLQDRFYRNFEGYSMLWDGIDIEDYVVASAPNGGAIALTLDSKKLRQYKGPDSRQTSVLVYSGAGKLIRKIPWDNGRIKGLGWSELDHLIVVSENGNARRYYDFEGNFNQFSLGRMAEVNGVAECQFWNSGFVALLSNNRFVSVSRYDEPNPKVLAKPNLEAPTSSGAVSGATPSPSISSLDKSVIHGWSIIPPLIDLGGQHVEVMLGLHNSVWVIDSNEAKDRYLQDGPFSIMAVSSNGDFIALYNPTSHILWVISADFNRKLSQYNTKKSASDSPPKQLVWCGNDAVALVWDDEITLVGPLGGSLTLYFDGTVVAIPEIDGIRTLTNEKHDFFCRVPDTTVDIFKIGSTSPAAILLDCIEQLDRKSPKADENLLIIADRLTEAVDACIEAAGYEFESIWQKTLLRAAAFGKSAIDLYSSDEFVRKCEHIRVLNSVRQFDVAILISCQQLLKLTPERLIDRLLIRRLHLLAFKCAEYLKLPVDKIYIHWACTKIKLSQADDETICREITNKIGSFRGISYEEISRTAYEEGRSDLAIMLIHYEPRPERQVPLLLNMQQEDLALDKAIESRNMDLVFYVLLVLQKKLPLANFFRFINDKPLASNCFKYLCKAQKPKLLKDFYYQDDRRLENAELSFVEAGEETELVDKVDKLKEAGKFYLELKDHNFEARAIDEEIKLVTLQDQLQRDYDISFAGMTISETLSSLIKISQGSRANKIKDEFKVPDHRFWWIKLRALVVRRDWENLLKFAKSKKSPIGYEPFFNECIKAGSKRNAKTYIPMCSNLDHTKRIEMWKKVDDIRQAAQEALRAKDIEALESLEALATNVVKGEIREYMDQLRRK